MIQQLFFYRRKVILTVYHDFDCQIKTRCIKEKLNSGVVYLEERFLNDAEIKDIVAGRQILKIEEGLFDSDKVNPYSTFYKGFNRICVCMKHFLCSDKPISVFSGVNISELQCKISDVELSNVLNFIKRYSGLDLYEKPVYLGDVFIFKPNVFNISSNKDWQLIVSPLKKGMHVTAVLFKSEDRVVGYCSYTAEGDTKKICFSPKSEWSCVDITITENGKLVYYAKSVLFLRNISMRGYIASDKFVPLKKIASECSLHVSELCSQSTIGHKVDNEYEILYQKNGEIAKKFKNLKASARFTFISDETKIQNVLEKIKNVMSEAQKELWIFDAYFTDSKNGLDKAIDWLRIMANLQVEKKCVVSYSRKNEKTTSDIVEFGKLIRNDAECARVIRNNGKLGINFIQTTKPIHDRFVIGVKDNGEFIGLSIGTSFNSLDSNFYCIIELSAAEAKKVHSTLTSWIYKKGMGESLEI